MSIWEYRPGTAVAVVSGASAVLVDVDAGEPLVAQLFDVLAGEHTIEDVIEVLLGRGLRHLGAFAAAIVEPDGVRVVVRGGFSAASPGADVVVGSGMWTDRTILGSSQVTLSRTGEAAEGPEFPVGLGTVLASSIRAGAPVRSADHGASNPQGELATGTAAPMEADAVEALRESVEAPIPIAEPVAEPVAQPEPAAVPKSVVAPEPVPEPTFFPQPEPELESSVKPAAEPEASIESRPDSVGGDQAQHDRPARVPSPLVEPPPPAGLLIESFPWAALDGGAAPESAVPSPQRPSFAESPAVVPPPQPAEPAAYDPEALEMTVDRGRLIEHAATSPNSVIVVAARCPSGHLSPAYADGCRVCHLALPPQQPIEVVRPPLGVLRLSNGDTVALDRGAILGRNPRLPAGFSGEQPNLVRLSDPGKDISSQHLEVTLDYWHVLVTDLGSTNGTEVTLPGQPPLQLRPNDPMTIEPGTRVTLAGVLDFVFEVSG